jgi:hypothetical protein
MRSLPWPSASLSPFGLVAAENPCNLAGTPIFPHKEFHMASMIYSSIIAIDVGKFNSVVSLFP